MSSLAEIAPKFVDMAHRIVWCTATTVARSGRPFSRILHPIWTYDDGELVGWIGTAPTPIKQSHIEANPYVALNYWDPTQDTCEAACRATWHMDDQTRTWLWDHFKNAPAPVGYDPAMIPQWNAPTDDGFAALRLDPYRLRVFPGSLLIEGKGEALDWRQ